MPLTEIGDWWERVGNDLVCVNVNSPYQTSAGPITACLARSEHAPSCRR